MGWGHFDRRVNGLYRLGNLAQISNSKPESNVTLVLTRHHPSGALANVEQYQFVVTWAATVCTVINKVRTRRVSR